MTAVHMTPRSSNDHPHIAPMQWTGVGTNNAGDETRRAST
jgi:hypothetical protein